MDSESAPSGAGGSGASSSGVPDAVLAVITQFILGVSLATSAVPPTVLSFQDRACETVGVFLVLVLTAVIAFPVRTAFGARDASDAEYMLAVLAPIATRLDLGLLIWVNVNKSLLWVEQIMYTTTEELECVSLLILASQVWHDGDNRIFDGEFGFYGGEAGVVMHQLQEDYHPQNAGGNSLAWVGHITLWPLAAVFHVLLQAISTMGFLVFWILQALASLTLRRAALSELRLRAPLAHFLWKRRGAQPRKLFMRHAAARVFDACQSSLSSSANHTKARQLWAMAASVDAILSHSHFKRLLEISYPLRAPVVHKRTTDCLENRDILERVLPKEPVLFEGFHDDPIVPIGAAASRQVVLYRVLGWPTSSLYSTAVLGKLTEFARSNMRAWGETIARLEGDGDSLAEFGRIRVVLRRALVQLVILAWCDGLGECAQDRTRSTSVTDDLTEAYLKSPMSSIEMCVRLINLPSKWNDSQQTSSMMISLATAFEECSCDVCTLMLNDRRLDTNTYLSKRNPAEMERHLQARGCCNASVPGQAWEIAVRQWIADIFEPEHCGYTVV